MWQAWRPAALIAYIERYESALPASGWPSWVLGNHDQKRIASRVGPAQARVAMLILLTLRGTPTLYYGDELGLENVQIPPERTADPFGLAHPDQGRDPVRTPMPWHSQSAHAGFTDGEPWLPLGEDHGERSVETQRDDPGSMLNLTRDLLTLRRTSPALSIGSWRPVQVDADVLAYVREAGGECYLILANLDDAPKHVGSLDGMSGEVVLSTIRGREGLVARDGFELAADEAVIIRPSASATG
jgi:glycosidase